ncbi:hypothetical protein SETIT_7G124800v2 [Setaria italica]|uniref:Uncharacterized protein n=1 Tax=Setaria italica TaxID=4555 RepID=A0A368RUX9_SETIT|nr:hypothetical protein SETIT_7G124800v2 [Setaria italica]
MQRVAYFSHRRAARSPTAASAATHPPRPHTSAKTDRAQSRGSTTCYRGIEGQSKRTLLFFLAPESIGTITGLWLAVVNLRGSIGIGYPFCCLHELRL